MLRNATDLQGYTIHAIDGDIGHVEQFYFDDEHWIVRYLVADAGNWLTTPPSICIRIRWRKALPTT